jgi:hypothetical protein
MNENLVLDPSRLSDLLLDAEQVWASARAVQKSNLVAIAPTFKGICDLSDVVVPDFFRGNDKRKPLLKLAWIEACTSNPQYHTDMWVRGVPCDFSGWTVGTANQEIEITSFVEDSFYIPYKIYDNLFTVEQLFVNAYNRCIKGIIEKVNAICIAKMVSYSGVNKFQDVKQMGKNGGGTGATAWKITDLPYLNLTEKGVSSYVGLAKVKNRMVNPSLFTGGALEVTENVDGSLEKFRFGGLEVYSDVIHFPENSLTNDMFLVSNGAMAFLNTWNYETTPTAPMGPEMEVYVAKALPSEYRANGYPIMVDITRKFIKREIAVGKYGMKNVTNQCEWIETYNVRLNFEVPLNPLACNEGQTGVIRLRSNDALPVFLSPSQIQQHVNVTPV